MKIEDQKFFVTFTMFAVGSVAVALNFLELAQCCFLMAIYHKLP